MTSGQPGTFQGALQGFRLITEGLIRGHLAPLAPIWLHRLDVLMAGWLLDAHDLERLLWIDENILRGFWFGCSVVFSLLIWGCSI